MEIKVNEASAILGVAQRTLLNYLYLGLIEGVQNEVSGRWTVDRDSVYAFLRSRASSRAKAKVVVKGASS